MKRLVAALAVVMSIQAGGCIVEEVDQERIAVSWKLYQGGYEMECAALGIDTINITSTSQTTDDIFVDIFDCGDDNGLTAYLDWDTYKITAEALTSAGTVTSEEEITLTLDGNEVSAPSAAFTFFFLGYNVSFAVDYGNAGGDNCTDNGVVQQTVFLSFKDGDQCLDATVSGVDQTSAAFEVDTCEEPALCMASSVTQTIKDLPIGDYTLTIHGLKGGVSDDTAICYIKTMDFSLDGTEPDLDVTLEVIAVPFDDSLDDNDLCNMSKPGR
ncbi:MAG: hypothetical protein V2A73_19615 [Pseudomonadota bacterium]